jgi:hypothetical protein
MHWRGPALSRTPPGVGTPKNTDGHQQIDRPIHRQSPSRRLEPETTGKRTAHCPARLLLEAMPPDAPFQQRYGAADPSLPRSERHHC